MDNQAFQLVQDALKRIESKLDAVTKDHDNRIDSLESTRDEEKGMARMSVIIASIFSGAISLFISFFKSH